MLTAIMALFSVLLLQPNGLGSGFVICRDLLSAAFIYLYSTTCVLTNMMMMMMMMQQTHVGDCGGL